MHLVKSNIGITGINSILCKHFVKNYSKKYNFIIYKGDINNIQYLKKWLLKNHIIKIFINFAALTSTKKCELDKKLANETNYKSVIKISNLFQKNKLLNLTYFLALSSSHVFMPSNNKLKETSKKNPINYYGMTKLNMEKSLLKEKKKFTVGIGRVFNYYNKSNKSGYFINDVLLNLKSTKKIITFNGVDTIRDFTEITDILSAINHMIVNKLSGDYNICSGKSFSLKKIIKTINKNLKKEILFNGKSQKGYVGDNTKLKKTGWLIKNPIKYNSFV